mmetsp:Transcript_35328/g.63727  ORF Transcript_35328/g.63727 Transcript_35328/m.63727 type:complete len:231 (-) Transcript_35328:456-1148(-)
MACLRRQRRSASSCAFSSTLKRVSLLPPSALCATSWLWLSAPPLAAVVFFFAACRTGKRTWCSAMSTLGLIRFREFAATAALLQRPRQPFFSSLSSKRPSTLACRASQPTCRASALALQPLPALESSRSFLWAPNSKGMHTFPASSKMGKPSRKFSAGSFRTTSGSQSSLEKAATGRGSAASDQRSSRSRLHPAISGSQSEPISVAFRFLPLRTAAAPPLAANATDRLKA